MNNVGDEGACAIAEAMASGKLQLKSLDLRSNGIGDKGVHALAAALSAEKCVLRKLNLHFNTFGGVGVCSLVTALSSDKTTLKKLGLIDCVSEECNSMLSLLPESIDWCTTDGWPIYG